MFSRLAGLIRVAAFSINKTIKDRSGLLFDLAQKTPARRFVVTSASRQRDARVGSRLTGFSFLRHAGTASAGIRR
jgi:hypothetical protein